MITIPIKVKTIHDGVETLVDAVIQERRKLAGKEHYLVQFAPSNAQWMAFDCSSLVIDDERKQNIKYLHRRV